MRTPNTNPHRKSLGHTISEILGITTCGILLILLLPSGSDSFSSFLTGQGDTSLSFNTSLEGIADRILLSLDTISMMIGGMVTAILSILGYLAFPILGVVCILWFKRSRSQPPSTKEVPSIVKAVPASVVPQRPAFSARKLPLLPLPPVHASVIGTGLGQDFTSGASYPTAVIQQLNSLLTKEVNEMNRAIAYLGINTEIDVSKTRYSLEWGIVRYTFVQSTTVAFIKSLASDLTVTLRSLRSQSPGKIESIVITDALTFDVSCPMTVESPSWEKAKRSVDQLSSGQALLGVSCDSDGLHPLVIDYTRGTTAHTMISGTTGSGKTTVFLNWLLSLCWSTSPEEIHILFASTKISPEHMAISRLPHVTIHRTVKECFDAICRVNDENTRREFTPTPKKVILAIDEYADLQTGVAIQLALGNLQKNDDKLMDNYFGSVAQAGRSRGVYLVLLTQKAVTNVVDTVIKANFPNRIGCKVMTVQEDRVAMGDREAPCHTLTATGSFYSSLNGNVPVIGRCFDVTESEINQSVDKIVKWWQKVPNAYRIPNLEAIPGTEREGSDRVIEVGSGPADRSRLEVEAIRIKAQKILEEYKLGDVFTDQGKVRRGMKTDIIRLLYPKLATSKNPNSGNTSPEVDSVLAYLWQYRETFDGIDEEDEFEGED